MIISVGDKVCLVRKYGKLNSVGSIYEIASFNDDKVIIRDTRTKIAIAAMTFDEIDKYFKFTKDITYWSEWRSLGLLDEDIFNSFVDFRFKGNRYVEVRVQYKNGEKEYVTHRASFNKKYDTEFDMHTGIRLALNRCMIDIYEMEYKKSQRRIDFINESISKAKFNISKITR